MYLKQQKNIPGRTHRYPMLIQMRFSFVYSEKPLYYLQHRIVTMVSRNLNLKHRFYLYFIWLIVFPILLLMCAFLYYQYQSRIGSRLRESEYLVRSYGEAIDQEIRTMTLKTSALAFNPDLADLAEEYRTAGSQNQSFLVQKKIEQMLNIYFDYSDDIISLVLFYKDGSVYTYKNPLNRDLGEIRETDWYRQINEKKGVVYLLDDLTYLRTSGTPYYRYGAAIAPTLRQDALIQSILVLFQSQTLNRISRIGAAGGRFAIYDLKGEQRFSSGLEGISKDYLTQSYNIGKTDWKITQFIELREFRKSIGDILLFSLMFILLISGLFILFARSQLHQIIDPINRSISQMSLLEKGDFSVRLDNSSIPELDRMAHSFNRMVREIENLTAQIQSREEEKRKLEIRSLQYQINPHFLSNTLNAIKVMARLAGTDEIRETTTCLMRILSESFRDPDPRSSLEQEIAVLKDYIQIMKIRFGDSFSVDYRLGEGTENLLVLKLLIQPVVENAVIHGLGEKGGTIRIHARLEGPFLIVSVEDSGGKMTALPEIREWENPHKGMYNVGLYNVIQRIHLNYGGEFGLRVTGENDRYTRVQLYLPQIPGDTDD